MLLLSLAACFSNWPMGSAGHGSTALHQNVSLCVLTTVYSTIRCLPAYFLYAVKTAAYVPLWPGIRSPRCPCACAYQ